MTVPYRCSCGHSGAFDRLSRGIEQTCGGCGRIIRVPLDGSAIDLSTSAPNDAAFRETLKLVRLTTSPNSPSQPLVSGRRRLVYLLAGAIVGAVLAFLIFRR